LFSLIPSTSQIYLCEHAQPHDDKTLIKNGLSDEFSDIRKGEALPISISISALNINATSKDFLPALLFQSFY